MISIVELERGTLTYYMVLAVNLERGTHTYYMVLVTGTPHINVPGGSQLVELE
jgi:hypothetical protein